MITQVLMHMVRVSFVLPALTPLESMKITHYPERLNEFGLMSFGIDEVAQPVRIGSTTLTRFRATTFDDNEYWVHMWANTSHTNHVSVCRRNIPVMSLTLTSVPHSPTHSTVNMQCEVIEPWRQEIQNIMGEISKNPQLLADLVHDTPTWSHDMLTLYRFCVLTKRPETI